MVWDHVNLTEFSIGSDTDWDITCVLPKYYLEQIVAGLPYRPGPFSPPPTSGLGLPGNSKLIVLTLDHRSSDDVCTKVDCGEGTCVPDLGGILFHCECKPGWKAIQIGPLSFPSCVVPNCTLNFTCGGPPIFTTPPLNFSSPCNLVWCGDGNCVVNGTGHYCQCNEGSDNLLDNPAFVCFKQCFYGADCHHLDVQQPPPPSTSSSPPGIGPKETSNCWRILPKLIIAILTTTTFLSWI